jgi:hypothetical protein
MDISNDIARHGILFGGPPNSSIPGGLPGGLSCGLPGGLSCGFSGGFSIVTSWIHAE